MLSRYLELGIIVAGFVLTFVVEGTSLGALGPSPGAQVLEVAFVKNSHGVLPIVTSGTSGGYRAFADKRAGAHHT